MRLVRKISRKRLYGVICYEYERLLIPVPSRDIDVVRPWLGRDLEVFVEPLREGLAILLCPEDRRVGLWRISSRFRSLVRRLEAEPGAST
ncbi:hypothetical protein AC482_05565 [miscellaneous Crenarchaeota group-15 archaeon DG-45]|uniref:Uncharacterized protein n=1 Tax=miscellaneous Crenarchaeota group-15 archaeon DG-45 TaxID=1685127 RepID=A0A0M0BMH5_9ARCH|nr:MAG: hypothetical protein AC482_05565 [miscellaneous Crenarchaeota group-15 archaeon DG-45]